VARLEQTRLAAVENQMGALLDLGRHTEVVADLDRLDPDADRVRIKLAAPE
jgi:hypothetical protein